MLYKPYNFYVYCNHSFPQNLNHWLLEKSEMINFQKAMRTVLVYRAVTKYVTLKNTVVYKILGQLEQSDNIKGK